MDALCVVDVIDVWWMVSVVLILQKHQPVERKTQPQGLSHVELVWYLMRLLDLGDVARVSQSQTEKIDLGCHA